MTGKHGGAFKRLVLNDFLFDRLRSIEGRSILELGAGNGYFMAAALRRFSGQRPERIVITDISARLLDLAQKHHRVAGAEYRRLDVRAPFAFEDGAFDLLIATMLANELSDAGLACMLEESFRVLAADGLALLSVTHPDLVERLHRRSELKREGRGPLTMPGSQGLRLPVTRRSKAAYEKKIARAGFDHKDFEVFPSEEVLREKPGLKKAGRVALALVFECRRRAGTVP
ncbi:MAG: class I SAM-dependent methyltransferase [Deltaproteobacteria bacterium]|nr:class I SAM-dependent methyltransferase [Deltaproteobacteria bacterium]